MSNLFRPIMCFNLKKLSRISLIPFLLFITLINSLPSKLTLLDCEKLCNPCATTVLYSTTLEILESPHKRWLVDRQDQTCEEIQFRDPNARRNLQEAAPYLIISGGSFTNQLFEIVDFTIGDKPAWRSGTGEFLHFIVQNAVQTGSSWQITFAHEDTLYVSNIYDPSSEHPPPQSTWRLYSDPSPSNAQEYEEVTLTIITSYSSTEWSNFPSLSPSILLPSIAPIRASSCSQDELESIYSVNDYLFSDQLTSCGNMISNPTSSSPCGCLIPMGDDFLSSLPCSLHNSSLTLLETADNCRQTHCTNPTDDSCWCQMDEFEDMFSSISNVPSECYEMVDSFINGIFYFATTCTCLQSLPPDIVQLWGCKINLQNQPWNEIQFTVADMALYCNNIPSCNLDNLIGANDRLLRCHEPLCISTLSQVTEISEDVCYYAVSIPESVTSAFTCAVYDNTTFADIATRCRQDYCVESQIAADFCWCSEDELSTRFQRLAEDTPEIATLCLPLLDNWFQGFALESDICDCLLTADMVALWGCAIPTPGSMGEWSTTPSISEMRLECIRSRQYEPAPCNRTDLQETFVMLEAEMWRGQMQLCFGMLERYEYGEATVEDTCACLAPLHPDFTDPFDCTLEIQVQQLGELLNKTVSEAAQICRLENCVDTSEDYCWCPVNEFYAKLNDLNDSYVLDVCTPIIEEWTTSGTSYRRKCECLSLVPEGTFSYWGCHVRNGLDTWDTSISLGDLHSDCLYYEPPSKAPLPAPSFHPSYSPSYEDCSQFIINCGESFDGIYVASDLILIGERPLFRSAEGFSIFINGGQWMLTTFSLTIRAPFNGELYPLATEWTVIGTEQIFSCPQAACMSQMPTAPSVSPTRLPSVEPSTVPSISPTAASPSMAPTEAYCDNLVVGGFQTEKFFKEKTAYNQRPWWRSDLYFLYYADSGVWYLEDLPSQSGYASTPSSSVYPEDGQFTNSQGDSLDLTFVCADFPSSSPIGPSFCRSIIINCGGEFDGVYQYTGSEFENGVYTLELLNEVWAILGGETDYVSNLVELPFESVSIWAGVQCPPFECLSSPPSPSPMESIETDSPTALYPSLSPSDSPECLYLSLNCGLRWDGVYKRTDQIVNDRYIFTTDNPQQRLLRNGAQWNIFWLGEETSLYADFYGEAYPLDIPVWFEVDLTGDVIQKHGCASMECLQTLWPTQAPTSPTTSPSQNPTFADTLSPTPFGIARFILYFAGVFDTIIGDQEFNFQNECHLVMSPGLCVDVFGNGTAIIAVDIVIDGPFRDEIICSIIKDGGIDLPSFPFLSYIPSDDDPDCVYPTISPTIAETPAYMNSDYVCNSLEFSCSTIFDGVYEQIATQANGKLVWKSSFGPILFLDYLGEELYWRTLGISTTILYAPYREPENYPPLYSQTWMEYEGENLVATHLCPAITCLTRSPSISPEESKPPSQSPSIAPTEFTCPDGEEVYLEEYTPCFATTLATNFDLPPNSRENVQVILVDSIEYVTRIQSDRDVELVWVDADRDVDIIGSENSVLQHNGLYTPEIGSQLGMILFYVDDEDGIAPIEKTIGTPLTRIPMYVAVVAGPQGAKGSVTVSWRGRMPCGEVPSCRAVPSQSPTTNAPSPLPSSTPSVQPTLLCEYLTFECDSVFDGVYSDTTEIIHNWPLYLSQSSALLYKHSDGYFIFSSARETTHLVSVFGGSNPLGTRDWHEKVNDQITRTFEDCSLKCTRSLSPSPSPTKSPTSLAPSVNPTQNCVVLSFTCNSEYDGFYSQTDNQRFESLDTPFQRIFVDDSKWILSNPSFDTYLNTPFNGGVAPQSRVDWTLTHLTLGDVGIANDCVTECLESFPPSLAPTELSGSPSSAPTINVLCDMIVVSGIDGISGNAFKRETQQWWETHDFQIYFAGNKWYADTTDGRLFIATEPSSALIPNGGEYRDIQGDSFTLGFECFGWPSNAPSVEPTRDPLEYCGIVELNCNAPFDGRYIKSSDDENVYQMGDSFLAITTFEDNEVWTIQSLTNTMVYVADNGADMFPSRDTAWSWYDTDQEASVGTTTCAESSMRCITAAPSTFPTNTPSLAPTDTCQTLFFQCETDFDGYYFADYSNSVNGLPIYRANEGGGILIFDGLRWTISKPLSDFHIRQDFANTAIPQSGDWELVNMQTKDVTALEDCISKCSSRSPSTSPFILPTELPSISPSNIPSTQPTSTPTSSLPTKTPTESCRNLRFTCDSEFDGIYFDNGVTLVSSRPFYQRIDSLIYRLFLFNDEWNIHGRPGGAQLKAEYNGEWFPEGSMTWILYVNNFAQETLTCELECIHTIPPTAAPFTPLPTSWPSSVPSAIPSVYPSPLEPSKTPSSAPFITCDFLLFQCNTQFDSLYRNTGLKMQGRSFFEGLDNPALKLYVVDSQWKIELFGSSIYLTTPDEGEAFPINNMWWIEIPSNEIIVCPNPQCLSSVPPTELPTQNPTLDPLTFAPSISPSVDPSISPSFSAPSRGPSMSPTTPCPSDIPSKTPSQNPSTTPIATSPSRHPSRDPSTIPTDVPSPSNPTLAPTEGCSYLRFRCSTEFDGIYSDSGIPVAGRSLFQQPSDSSYRIFVLNNNWRIEKAVGNFMLTPFNGEYLPIGNLTWIDATGNSFVCFTECLKTLEPTKSPSRPPSPIPTMNGPTNSPEHAVPTASPSIAPTFTLPSNNPSKSPSPESPTLSPSISYPSRSPSLEPTISDPTRMPSSNPVSSAPSQMPSSQPTSADPSKNPSDSPLPSDPSVIPSNGPSSAEPTDGPSPLPSTTPSAAPIIACPFLHFSCGTIYDGIFEDRGLFVIEDRPFFESRENLGLRLYRSGNEWQIRYGGESTYLFTEFQGEMFPNFQTEWFEKIGDTTNFVNCPPAECLTTLYPSSSPSRGPSLSPQTSSPSISPSTCPSKSPSTTRPTNSPSIFPSKIPSGSPSKEPSVKEPVKVSSGPSHTPITSPSKGPSLTPSRDPSSFPSNAPTYRPSASPSKTPSTSPTKFCRYLDFNCETPFDDIYEIDDFFTSVSSSPFYQGRSNNALRMYQLGGDWKIEGIGFATHLRAPSDDASYPLTQTDWQEYPTGTAFNCPKIICLTSLYPTTFPSTSPTVNPSSTSPSTTPSRFPSNNPTTFPTSMPSVSPSATYPSYIPSNPPQSSAPSLAPSQDPSIAPSSHPTSTPSRIPSFAPSMAYPTINPSRPPDSSPPSTKPTSNPSVSAPSDAPMFSAPTQSPIVGTNPPTTPLPSAIPSRSPSKNPSSENPTSLPSKNPSLSPTINCEFLYFVCEAIGVDAVLEAASFPVNNRKFFEQISTGTRLYLGTDQWEFQWEFASPGISLSTTFSGELYPLTQTTWSDNQSSDVYQCSPVECLLTVFPTTTPTSAPIKSPTTALPSYHPLTSSPSTGPSSNPSFSPSNSDPSNQPSTSPIATHPPSSQPTGRPSVSPSTKPPSTSPTGNPFASEPSKTPTSTPTEDCPYLEFTCSTQFDGVYGKRAFLTEERRSYYRHIDNPGLSLFAADGYWNIQHVSDPTYLRAPFTGELYPTNQVNWFKMPSGQIIFCPPIQCLASVYPTSNPSVSPSRSPISSFPTKTPSTAPVSSLPTQTPSQTPSSLPIAPSAAPAIPTKTPSKVPTPAVFPPTIQPSQTPSIKPSFNQPSQAPTLYCAYIRFNCNLMFDGIFKSVGSSSFYQSLSNFGVLLYLDDDIWTITFTGEEDYLTAPAQNTIYPFDITIWYYGNQPGNETCPPIDCLKTLPPTIQPTRIPSLSPSISLPTITPISSSPSIKPTINPFTTSPSMSPSLKPVADCPYFVFTCESIFDSVYRVNTFPVNDRPYFQSVSNPSMHMYREEDLWKFSDLTTSLTTPFLGENVPTGNRSWTHVPDGGVSSCSIYCITTLPDPTSSPVTSAPSTAPIYSPSKAPLIAPTTGPVSGPTLYPTETDPSASPSIQPSLHPTKSSAPTLSPTIECSVMYFYDDSDEFTGIYFYDRQEYDGGRTFSGSEGGSMWKQNVRGISTWFVFNGRDTIQSPPADLGSDLPPEGNWTYHQTHNDVPDKLNYEVHYICSSSLRPTTTPSRTPSVVPSKSPSKAPTMACPIIALSGYDVFSGYYFKISPTQYTSNRGSIVLGDDGFWTLGNGLTSFRADGGDILDVPPSFTIWNIDTWVGIVQPTPNAYPLDLICHISLPPSSVPSTSPSQSQPTISPTLPPDASFSPSTTPTTALPSTNPTNHPVTSSPSTTPFFSPTNFPSTSPSLNPAPSCDFALDVDYSNSRFSKSVLFLYVFSSLLLQSIEFASSVTPSRELWALAHNDTCEFVYHAEVTWEELYDQNWGNLTLIQDEGNWTYRGAINAVSDSVLYTLSYDIIFPSKAGGIPVEYDALDLDIFLAKISTQAFPDYANLTVVVAIRRKFPWELTRLQFSKTPTNMLHELITSTTTCTFTEGFGEICEESWTIVATLEYLSCSISGEYALDIAASPFGSSDEEINVFNFSIDSSDLCDLQIGEEEISSSLDTFSDPFLTNKSDAFETSQRVYFLPQFTSHDIASPSFSLHSISIIADSSVIEVYSANNNIAAFDVNIGFDNHFSLLLTPDYIPATVEGIDIDVDVEFQVAYETGRRRLKRINWKVPKESISLDSHLATAHTQLLIKTPSLSTVETHYMFWHLIFISVISLSFCMACYIQRKQK